MLFWVAMALIVGGMLVGKVPPGICIDAFGTSARLMSTTRPEPPPVPPPVFEPLTPAALPR